MTLEYLFEDKSIKAKAKAKRIAEWLLYNELAIDEWLAFTEKQRATDKATCIEALEAATEKSKTSGNCGYFRNRAFHHSRFQNFLSL